MESRFVADLVVRVVHRLTGNSSFGLIELPAFW